MTFFDPSLFALKFSHATEVALLQLWFSCSWLKEIFLWHWCLINSGAGYGKPQNPLDGTTLLQVNKGLLWESGKVIGGGHGIEFPCR